MNKKIIAVWLYCQMEYSSEELSLEIKEALCKDGVMVKDEQSYILNPENSMLRTLMEDIEDASYSVNNIMLALYYFYQSGQNVWPNVISGLLINQEALKLMNDTFSISATEGRNGKISVKFFDSGIEYIDNLWEEILQG